MEEPFIGDYDPRRCFTSSSRLKPTIVRFKPTIVRFKSTIVWLKSTTIVVDFVRFGSMTVVISTVNSNSIYVFCLGRMNNLEKEGASLIASFGRCSVC